MATGVFGTIREVELVLNSKDNPTTDAISEQLDQLTKKFVDLDKRLQRVEDRLDSPMEELGGKEVFEKPTYACEMSGAREKALASVNRIVISNRPLNLDPCSKVRDVCVMMKSTPYSICQLLLLILAIAGLLVFVIISLEVAYDSTNAEFKPIKVVGIDRYLDSADLTYKTPLHYVWIGETVSYADFDKAYHFWFGWQLDHDSYCTSSIETCLNDLMESRNLEYVVYPISQQCYNDHNNRSLKLRNMTITADVQSLDDHDFDVIWLFKFEFDDFKPFERDWFYCTMSVDWGASIFWDSNYSAEVAFFVSRTENAAPSGFNLMGQKHVGYTSIDHSSRKSVNYVYSEETIDGMPEFTAVIDEFEFDDYAGYIDIRTVADPTIVHWESYTTYSYSNWLADVGGFYTLVGAIFFVLSKKLVEYANRNDPFHRRMGILPLMSMTYRNAEMLAGVRGLLVSALSISEGEYFAAPAQITSVG